MKSIVYWKSTVTGKLNHGEPTDRDYAHSECREANKMYPSIQHWVVDVSDYPESDYKKTKEQ